MRNQTWNMPSAFIGHLGLVMAKNPANAKFFWNVFKDNFTQGLHSAQSALTTGDISTDDGKKRGFFEDAIRNSNNKVVKNFFRHYAIPGKLLKAGDVIISVPLEQVKKAEQLFNMIKKESNGELTNKQIREGVNDILAHTEERFVESSEKAFKEVGEFYGLSEKGINTIEDLKQKIKDLKAEKKSLNLFKRKEINKEIDFHKKIVLDYNLSITDNMDRDIYDNIQKSDIFSEDIKEYLDVKTVENTKDYARKWAQTASLLAHPKGTLGVAAHFIHEIAGAFPGSKFILLTFVNAPLNITNSLIDRSAFGFLRYGTSALRGRRGSIVSTPFLEKHRLEINSNPDEQRELIQRAITYTAMQVALLALGTLKYIDDDGEERKILDITGPRSDDFDGQIQKQDADNRKPYHVYMYGREIMNYKSSYLMPLFLPIGTINDYNELNIGKGKEGTMMKSITHVFLAYIYSIKDQSSLSSVNELYNGVRGSFKKAESSIDKEGEESSFIGNVTSFSAEKAVKIGRSLLFPNYILQANKDVRGLLEMDQKKAVEWHDYFIDDIPVLEDMFLADRTDHFGRTLPEEFSIPLIPFEKKGNEYVFNFVTDIKKNDKYYGSDLRHDYQNSNISNQTIKEYNYDEHGIAVSLKGERKLSKTEIEKLNTEVGKKLRKILDTETVDENGGKSTVLDELDKITDNEYYKKTKNKYRDTAKKMAIYELFYKKEEK